MVRLIRSEGYAYPLPEGATTEELLELVPGEQTRMMLARALEGEEDVTLSLTLADALLAAVAECERQRAEEESES